MKIWLKMIFQIFILWLIYQIGNLLVSFLNIPLPGNVFGMIILFLLLSFNIVKVSWIKEGTEILLKHLAFFFIPIAVGLMAWGELFVKSGIWLITALVASALVSILTTGWLVEITSKSKVRNT